MKRIVRKALHIQCEFLFLSVACLNKQFSWKKSKKRERKWTNTQHPLSEMLFLTQKQQMHSEWRAKTKNTSNLNWLKESKTLRSSKNGNTCLTYCLRQCWWWRKQKIRIISTYKREDNESNQKIYWAHNLREKRKRKTKKKHTRNQANITNISMEWKVEMRQCQCHCQYRY